jgi:hypothetical protein
MNKYYDPRGSSRRVRTTRMYACVTWGDFFFELTRKYSYTFLTPLCVVLCWHKRFVTSNLKKKMMIKLISLDYSVINFLLCLVTE